MAAIRRRVAGRSTGMFLSRSCEFRFSKYAESTTTPGRRARRVLQAGSAAGSENRNAAGAAAHDRRNEAAERPARRRLPQFRVMRGALRGGGGGGKNGMGRISRNGERRVKGAAILTTGPASTRRAKVPGAPAGGASNAARKDGAVRDAMRTSPSVSSRQGVAAACPGSRSIRDARRAAMPDTRTTNAPPGKGRYSAARIFSAAETSRPGPSSRARALTTPSSATMA